MEDADAFTIEMERPLPVEGQAKGPTRPTPREEELEAESFMALYAQVNSG